jgi:hypothetical protein
MRWLCCSCRSHEHQQTALTCRRELQFSEEGEVGRRDHLQRLQLLLAPCILIAALTWVCLQHSFDTVPCLQCVVSICPK